MSLENVREILTRLVSFDTTSAKPNLPLIEYAANYLRRVAGVPHVRVIPADDGIHADLLATLPAADGGVTGGLILSGHSDVVPVTGQKWDTDPFALTEKDGKLYGRGSCDMKGFLAIVLALAPQWVKKPLSKPLHIVFTYNEETDLAGYYTLAEKAGQDIKGCEGCIVGEPTRLQLAIAHKGISSSRIDICGEAAHSSRPDSGNNALEPAARLLSRLFALRDSFVKSGPFDERFAVPHTTLCPSIVEAGIAVNTIPDACSIQYEFRNIHQHAADAILATIQSYVDEENAAFGAKFPNNGVKMAVATQNIPFNGNEKAAVVTNLRAAVGDGQPITTVSFYTEAAEYQHFGIDTVVCGPGDIEQAHKANEFIEIEQLRKGLAAVDKVVRLMCVAAGARL